MTLGMVCKDRDNNFNLIRIAASLLVLITHSFALATGSGDAEPLRTTLGITLGVIAVDLFFVTSGFLVTASLLARKSTWSFVCARVLRIYPALVVMVSLTVFCLGAAITTLPLESYFSSEATYRYLIKNCTLLSDVSYHLPGVFETVPAKNTVNGSLWTMPIEVKMYLTLALLWAFTRLTASRSVRSFQVLIVLLAVSAGVAHVLGHMYFPKRFPLEGPTRLFFMFFTGAAFYVLRDFVVLSRTLFIVMIAATLLASVDSRAFHVVYSLSIAYLVLFLAYVPEGLIRKYNRLGDYSYGIYIYAFPVQQSVALFIPNVSAAEMIAVSSVITWVLAALSWHMLEEKALKLKSNILRGHQYNQGAPIS
jgi:peptidoglycan/LPS O-acetylase OafA/YrhL